MPAALVVRSVVASSARGSLLPLVFRGVVSEQETASGRPLWCRNRKVGLSVSKQRCFLTGEEKGIDVRLALDVIALGQCREYDVALVMRQDQDLSEVAEEIRTIAREQRRWIKIASAVP